MPVIHSESFRARYYECDAHGHLTHLTYLRWMQEAAFAASTAVGYDLTRYNDLRQVWLVRETDVDYITPVHYGETIVIRTWVADFRRSHSLRRYEFIRVGTEEIVARAATDWVYIDTQTLRPVSVPLTMQLAFCPEGNRLPEVSRTRLPAPAAPPNAFSFRTRVDWRAIDTMWHVNNAMYLAYVEEAGWRLWEGLGWPMARRLARGLELAARQHQIEYRIPAQLDDELEVATWFSAVRPASVWQQYIIYRANDHAVLARARARWVWIDLKTRRPMRIPPEIQSALIANLSPRPEPPAPGVNRTKP
jgi:acyl-CoA thioester hydrolase